MVMQARKLPRLSDGYFDRNQSHSFESSGKYSKSNDRNDRLKGSPVSSNSNVPNRNDISENKSSPRYHRHSSQRLKDKDHHEDSNKSPAVKGDSRSSTNKTSCDRDGISDRHHNTQCTNQRVLMGLQKIHSELEQELLQEKLSTEKRLPPVIDWSEHLSSSGKKYYYNCKTEVSQWEKPKELIEWERQQSLNRLAFDQANRNKERIHERPSAASGSKNAHAQQDSQSENCVENDSHGSDPNRGAQHHLLSPSQVTLSNLPKLISQLAGTKGLPNLSDLSPQEALRTIQQALQLTKQATNLSQVTDSHHPSKPTASPAQSQANQVNHHPIANQSSSNLPSNSTLHVNSTSSHYNDIKNNDIERNRDSPGSDSSTHSVRHDSPTSSVSSLQSLGAGAGTSSLATAALKPALPSLTPSLANYYREDLITHVTGWQADHAERQANRYWEDGHNIGSLSCTQVSAELKMARALVRLAEIQATLQEQRILFLKQQTKELEEWRSLNSFMGDS